jgi:poly(A) polymerase
MIDTEIKSISLSLPLFKDIGLLADGLGVKCYAVGGFVRDTLLGKPCKDIDIMVIGEPVAFARAVKAKLGGQHLVVFERFRTAQLELNGLKLEFVGARKESYNHESRKPIVEIGTLEDDLARRDFTINAMAASLNAASFGELIDLFGGKSDLEKKNLRTPLEPAATFSDDPLRMMRAARFAAKLKFTIEPSVLDAMEAMRERIGIVSQERITDELLKILMADEPSIGFIILYNTRVLDIIFPELPVMAGVVQIDGLGHKDTFFHTLKVVDNICKTTDNVWLRLAALLHDVAKPKTKRFIEGKGWSFHGHDELGARMIMKIFRRMKLPLSNEAFVEKMVRLHLRPIPLSREEITDSAIRRLIFDAGEHLHDLMTLCRADITSKNPKKVARILENFAKVEEKIHEVSAKDEFAKWRPPVDGVEIMQMFGLPPGKIVGGLKKAMEDAILDGVITNDREASIEFLKTKFAEMQAIVPPNQDE